MPSTAGVSVLLFVPGLVAPAYTVQGPEGPQVVYGFLELIVGWLGVAYGIHEWLANPLLLVTWFLMLATRYRQATITGMSAMLISASFLIRDTVIISEAPTYGRILAHHAGYWLWIASSAVAGLASAKAMREAGQAAT